jgi:hypothetical protein
MTRKQIRSAGDSTLPRFFYTICTGLLTGLLIFFVTNCVLPPALLGEVRNVIWQSRELGERPRPEREAAGVVEFEGGAAQSKTEAGSADHKDQQSSCPSVRVQFVSKDEMVITVNSKSTSDTPPAPPKPPTSTISCKPESTCSSPWVPVFADSGNR